MSYDIAKFWIDIIQTLMTVAVVITLFIMRNQTATTQNIDAMGDANAKEFESHNVRITRTEEALKHCPTHEDLRKICDKLNETNGEIRELIGEMKYIARSSESLRQNELEKSK